MERHLMKTDLRSLTFAVLAAPLLALGQATISTVAGTGTSGFSGDGGPAASARISASASFGVVADNAGNFYICDGGNNRIRKVNAAGVISTVAGGGSAVGGGDGGPATNAQLFPGSVAVDGAGNLYIAQGASIRKVSTTGIITTIAGTGKSTKPEEGKLPTESPLNRPHGVVVGPDGLMYIADSGNNRIVRIEK